VAAVRTEVAARAAAMAVTAVDEKVPG